MNSLTRVVIGAILALVVVAAVAYVGIFKRRRRASPAPQYDMSASAGDLFIRGGHPAAAPQHARGFFTRRRRSAAAPQYDDALPGAFEIQYGAARGIEWAGGMAEPAPHDLGDAALPRPGMAWPEGPGVPWQEGRRVVGGGGGGGGAEILADVAGDFDFRDAAVGVAEEQGTDTTMYWNVRSPELSGPRTVLVNNFYDIETAIELNALGAGVMGFRAQDLVGRAITFAFKGDGVEFATTEPDKNAVEVRSSPLACGPTGTKTFQTRWRATRAGAVSIMALLEVDNRVLGQLGFALTANAEDGEARVDASAQVSVEVVQQDLDDVQPADALLEFHRDEATINVGWYPTGGERTESALFNKADVVNNHTLDLRELLEARSHAYPLQSVAAVDLPDDNELREIARIGSQFYRLLFGTGEWPQLQKLADAIGGMPVGARIEIDDCGAAIPWGVVYDSDPEGPIDPERFWGARFCLSRRVLIHGEKAPATAVRKLRPRLGDPGIAHSFVNPHVEPDAVAHQTAMLDALESSMHVAVRGHARSDLVSWLTPPGTWNQADLFYVFAHAEPSGVVGDLGIPSGRWPAGSAFIDLDSELGDDLAARLTTDEMLELRRPQERFAPLPDWPIAFINACKSGKADAQCIVNPIVQLFLDYWSVAAFVGTDWSTPQRFAAPFGQSLLTELAKPNARVADALWSTIHEYVTVHRNPFALNYCMYGRADASLNAHAYAN